jgi:hypothetical protein
MDATAGRDMAAFPAHARWRLVAACIALLVSGCGASMSICGPGLTLCDQDAFDGFPPCADLASDPRK